MEKLSTSDIDEADFVTFTNGIPNILPEGWNEKTWIAHLYNLWNITPADVHALLRYDSVVKSSPFKMIDHEPLKSIVQWIADHTVNERKKLQKELQNKKWLQPVKG